MKPKTVRESSRITREQQKSINSLLDFTTDFRDKDTSYSDKGSPKVTSHPSVPRSLESPLEVTVVIHPENKTRLTKEGFPEEVRRLKDGSLMSRPKVKTHDPSPEW